MTHQPQATEREANFQPESWRDELPAGTWNDMLDLLCDHGFAGMAQAMQVLFNEAMKLACQAGRLASHAGRIPRKPYATASSPEAGVLSPSVR